MAPQAPSPGMNSTVPFTGDSEGSISIVDHCPLPGAEPGLHTGPPEDSISSSTLAGVAKDVAAHGFGVSKCQDLRRVVPAKPPATPPPAWPPAARLRAEGAGVPSCQDSRRAMC
mmetsp:Transcript_37733/g.106625  ORF Transcript_37733/g.106625 Transcript_37733/m.106625 type:complete len:114 (-) Transcript_37733:501-842(-)